MGFGVNSPWPTLHILFILDCQKKFNIQNKVAESYYENFKLFWQKLLNVSAAYRMGTSLAASSALINIIFRNVEFFF